MKKRGKWKREAEKSREKESKDKIWKGKGKTGIGGEKV